MLNHLRSFLRALVRLTRECTCLNRANGCQRFLCARDLATKSNNYVCGDEQSCQHPAKSRCTGGASDGGCFPHRASIIKFPHTRLLRFRSEEHTSELQSPMY